VRVVRFDEEIALPVSDSDSRFRIGPLTGDDTEGRVQMLHVAPGGRIGRHVAPSRQLLGVVSGAGWAEGSDGVRRDLRPGYGVVWEPGEEHEAGTDSGFTAVCVEGRFEVWAVSVTKELVVLDYDPAWPEWFETVHAYVWPEIDDVALRIDHVGSTSVPGLAAKPIIDMDIVVADETQMRPVIDRLRTLGYRWTGDLGVPGRHAFHLDRDADLPAHNLYLVVENNKAHLDHWLLRDLLREDADARRRYGKLKGQNAEAAGDDIDVYVARKAAFVAELLTRAREERGLPPAEYWTP
jgi:GrpB-like predicted nucleotidyltransferase (UPF0157 family)/quercetin dioxygenase-like cupin family protein